MVFHFENHMQPQVPRDQSLPLHLGPMSKLLADQGGGSVAVLEMNGALAQKALQQQPLLLSFN